MKTRLRYFALFAFAVVPLLEVGQVKPLPLSLIAGVFLIHASLALGTRRREHSLPRDVRSALLPFGCLGPRLGARVSSATASGRGACPPSVLPAAAITW